jgi:hypothetical protein
MDTCFWHHQLVYIDAAKRRGFSSEYVQYTPLACNTIVILLPILDCANTERINARLICSHKEIFAFDMSQNTILIVEDETIVASDLANKLKQRAMRLSESLHTLKKPSILPGSSAPILC